MINDISPRTAMGSFPVAAESYGYASDVIPDPDYPEPSPGIQALADILRVHKEQGLGNQ